MYNLCRILQHVVNGFDNVSLAQHHSVIERHQLVFHVYAQPCHQLYSILKGEVKQLLRNIAFVSEQIAIQPFSKNLEHIRVLVADICTSKYKRYYLASVIARKMELKAMDQPIVPFPSVAIPLNTLLAYLLRLWYTGIIVESTNVMPVHLPKAPRLRKNMSWKNSICCLAHQR